MAVSGAMVAVAPAPASIQPEGFSRHAPVPVTPGQAAPLQPRCSSQNTFSLLRVEICQVRRMLAVRFDESVRACSASLGTYVQAFGLPALALANIPGTDCAFPR